MSEPVDPLRAAADERPDDVALEDRRGRLTWRELDRAAGELARRLAGAGVSPGDRVAALLPVGREAVLALHGVPRTGASLAPVHPGWTEAEVDGYLRRVRPRALLCRPATEDRAAASLRASGLLVRLGPAARGPGGEEPGPEASGPADGAAAGAGPADEGAAEAGAVAVPAADLPAADDVPGIDPEAEHTLVATSGTSGRPRGVRLSLANHRACQRAAARRLGLGPEDRWLATLSPAHVGGVALVLRAAFTGARLVLRSGFDAEALLELADEDRISHASLVPTMLRRLLEIRGAEPAPEALGGLLVGGDAADPSLLTAALERGWPVCPTYGLTEAASQVATAPPAVAREHPTSVGRPLEGVEVRIEGGEILVRGPTVGLGYLGSDRAPGSVVREGRVIPRQGEETPGGDGVDAGAQEAGEALVDGDGWLRTGDGGRLDDAGRLHVTGRLSERIVTGGVTVDPTEVERVLRAHPEVRDACVVGVPDEEWGERVSAAVERDPDAPEADPDDPLGRAELAVWFGDRLAPAKRPRQVRFVDELPRTPEDKPDRETVRRWLG